MTPEERVELIKFLEQWVVSNVPGKVSPDKLNPVLFMAITGLLAELKGLKREAF
jgi:hypothetical protein